MVNIPPQYRSLVEEAARKHGVPVEALAGIFQQETGWNPSLRGKAGEIGIGQILPSTGARPGYGVPPISPEDAARPEASIPWTANYLAARTRGTDWGDRSQWPRALARYNGAGPAAERYGQTVARIAGAGPSPAPAKAEEPIFQELQGLSEQPRSEQGMWQQPATKQSPVGMPPEMAYPMFLAALSRRF